MLEQSEFLFCIANNLWEVAVEKSKSELVGNAAEVNM
jgi:hypothetical protein